MSKFPTHSKFRVILSPHPDDAVLSLGACIPVWRREQCAVRVVTVFDGHPGGELTPAAIEDRQRYLGDPVAIRKQEDLAAVSFLGAELVSLDIPELVYRYRSDGTARCMSLDDIFGALEPDDEPIVTRVAEAFEALDIEEAIVYAPLSTGGHCDHRIVRKAAEMVFAADGLCFYDDMPYAMRQKTHDASIRWPEVTNDDIERWLEATSIYGSQMLPLFESEPDWRNGFREWSKLKRA